MEEGQTQDEEWVVSEVHMVLPELPPEETSETRIDGEPIYISRFPFYANDRSSLDEGEGGGHTSEEEGREGAPAIQVDEEGDIIVPRRKPSRTRRRGGRQRETRRQAGAITILHTLRSSLPSVGLQVQTSASSSDVLPML